MFWYALFYKNLIVLNHGDNNFLFYFLFYDIHTFNNNFNDEEMITIHLMCAINMMLSNNFLMINISCLREQKTFLHSKT